MATKEASKKDQSVDAWVAVDRVLGRVAGLVGVTGALFAGLVFMV